MKITFHGQLQMCLSIRMSQKKLCSNSRLQIVKPSNSKLKKAAVIKKPIKIEPSEKIADKFTYLMEAEVVAKYATSFLRNS